MRDTEHSLVRFGCTAIPYQIERGRRHRTVAIAVDPECGIRVRAPQHTPVTKLDDIVRLKAKWIIDKRRKQDDMPPRPTPREFISGETFLYSGRQYRLKVIPYDPAIGENVRLIGSQLQVNSGCRVRDSLIAWFRKRAHERLGSRVQVWGDRLNVHWSNVLVRDQRARWGSADTKGNLRFNWRIVQAPTRLLDYVVAHELVHLLHADHTREFWATLGRVMPDYEIRREKLRQAGRAMVW